MKKTNFINIYLQLFIIYIQIFSIKNDSNLKIINNKIFNYKNENIYYDNNIVSKFLYNNVKIFCLILTGPQYITSRVNYQKETWLNRCNDFLYVSSLSNISLPSIGVDVVEGRDTLWEKIRYGIEYVYKYYFNNYDWFLLIDDDSYVFMENLRFFLLSKNSNNLLHYGFRMKDLKSTIKEGYIQGGSGDVLSKMVLKKLVNIGFKNDSICKKYSDNSGDVELGECLSNIGIKIGESRDFLSRLTFIPGPPDAFTGVSDNSIYKSFNKLSYYMFKRGHNMYIIEYLLYQANVFGRQSTFNYNITRNKINDDYLKKLLYKKLNNNL
ncbi:Glycoprotein-N-acetylgalactosamine 3-beta-galactosyltransferase 1 [Strongyloides ratti]|uniref:N-acetylgalactosaminide beta-1,3-galactosyltransferase n=1 Tax=Strongyloides ratti TaxID=34506 RepID=A0A090KYM0_STRRB|nr:Glycoprotein-N-acetylgalactosamine 3-beta-galactosyltransferase 1 [Strongyloides ratti]CEF60304.1 Glycoprotein-N-acetylgalactosamine 3-beta-galactosyltransferase 1 [Strongyloides ratti]